MKLVTAMSTAALVLAPAAGLAQDSAKGAGNTLEQTGLANKVEHMIGTITGGSSDTKESADAKSGDRDSAATSSGDTNYSDRASVKRTGK
ncbi:MAG: hypothetical protein WBD78_09290 [Methylocella sp.]